MDAGYAMIIDAPGAPLRKVVRPVPQPGRGDMLLEVLACGVCRTDLHVLDGEVAAARYPIVPGHEVVGRVLAMGSGADGFAPGDRVGVAWLGASCGRCPYCRSDRENLCDQPVFTGATRDGGYATHMLADPRFCFPIPAAFGDVEAAPLLCAGLIGYRSLRLAGQPQRLGLYGFGASAHIVAQVAKSQGVVVYAFTRPGDTAGQRFALDLGCVWAGGSDEMPPALLDAAIIFAADGTLVPSALAAVGKGSRVVCAGIHMSDIPGFPYDRLWGERSIISVANLTRADAREFLELAAKVPVRTTTTVFPLERAAEALQALRAGAFEGGAVLVP